MMVNAFTSGSVATSSFEDTFCFDNFAHTNTTNVDADDAFFLQPPSAVVQDEIWAPPVFASDEELYLFASSGADFDLTSTPQIQHSQQSVGLMNTTTTNTTPSSPNSSSEDDNTPMTPPREHNSSSHYHQANQVITTSTIDVQLQQAYDKLRTTTLPHHYGTTNYHYYNNSVPVIAREDVVPPPQQLPIQLHLQTVPPQIQFSQIPPPLQPTLNTSISTTSTLAQEKKAKKTTSKRQDDEEYCQDEHEPNDDEDDEELDDEDNDYDYASKSKSQVPKKKKQKRVTSNSKKSSSSVCAGAEHNGGCNAVTGGEQAECCIIDCTNAVTNRLRFSLRCHKGNEFKQEYLNCGWNKVCHYHYFSDLYKYKKSLSKGGATNNDSKKSKKNEGKKKKRSRDTTAQLDDSQATMVASALDVQNFSLLAPVDSADLKKSLRGRNMRSAKRRQLD